MEQQTETAPVVDERRKRLLASLEKARAVRARKIAARKEGAPESERKLAEAHDIYKAMKDVPGTIVDGRVVRKRRKTAKSRLDDAIVQHKLAKKKPALPEDWLAGIHHMPDGCAAACRGGICVITAENVCGHPDTNLQSKYLTGAYPDVTDRFHAAKHELRRLDAEKSLKK